MIFRWGSAPRAVRVTALVLVTVLTYGAVVHVVQVLAHGFDAHDWLPTWLRVYFLSLTLLDPLAAVLLALRLRIGVVVSVVVLLTDAMANGYANYALDPAPGVTVARVGHGVLTALAVGACVAAPLLWRNVSRTA